MTSRFFLFPVLVVSIGLGVCLITGCLPAPDKATLEKTESAPATVNPDELREIVELTLDRNLRLRGLAQNRNAAWQVIHGAVAYGDKLLMEVEGESVLALPYLFQGGELAGWELREGDLIPQTGERESAYR